MTLPMRSQCSMWLDLHKLSSWLFLHNNLFYLLYNFFFLIICSLLDFFFISLGNKLWKRCWMCVASTCWSENCSVWTLPESCHSCDFHPFVFRNHCHKIKLKILHKMCQFLFTYLNVHLDILLSLRSSIPVRFQSFQKIPSQQSSGRTYWRGDMFMMPLDSLHFLEGLTLTCGFDLNLWIWPLFCAIDQTTSSLKLGHQLWKWLWCRLQWP